VLDDLALLLRPSIREDWKSCKHRSPCGIGNVPYRWRSGYPQPYFDPRSRTLPVHSAPANEIVKADDLEIGNCFAQADGEVEPTIRRFR